MIPLFIYFCVLQPRPALFWTRWLVRTSSQTVLERLPLFSVCPLFSLPDTIETFILSQPLRVSVSVFQGEIRSQEPTVLRLLIADWARAFFPSLMEDFIDPETFLCCNSVLIVNSSQGLHDGSFRTDETSRQGRDMCSYVRSISNYDYVSVYLNGRLFCLG